MRQESEPEHVYERWELVFSIRSDARFLRTDLRALRRDPSVPRRDGFSNSLGVLRSVKVWGPSISHRLHGTAIYAGQLGWFGVSM